MAPGVAAQIYATIREMDERRGRERTLQLAANTAHFRQRLKEMGFIVFGHNASPVVPMMIYMPSKLLAFRKRFLINIIS